MGIRADFYLGRDKETMTWLGSLRYDGSPFDIQDEFCVSDISCETDFQDEVRNCLGNRDHSSIAGSENSEWPWMWQTSGSVDYVYAYDDGQIWIARFGKGWVSWDTYMFAGKVHWDTLEDVDFPDMSEEDSSSESDYEYAKPGVYA